MRYGRLSGRYKARLVAKALVSILALIISKPLLHEIHCHSRHSCSLFIEDFNLPSVDISRTFINGELNTKIYMEQPEGFEGGEPNHVCLLEKGLYCFKQASRLWYQKLKGVLGRMDFKNIYSHNSNYVFAKDNVKVILPVFDDDCTFASN
ncbi:hypothetical protein EW146_g7733 [Bondarzewia mesenterica]|uniref:Reverse transcriptase Ty1/copia-type domain-containing protein n=1 Tax=Bondarzewia mesenterica TaxID=1095465 RepID=A0A4S4LKL3_9AGAM|nr:hypothetical protein EW146_g7733 [Bondarzewia mesenterica]